MAQVQVSHVISPEKFTPYQVKHSLVSTALLQIGVVVNHALIADQLQAGAESFTIPFWADLSDAEADTQNDDPTDLPIPRKIGAAIGVHCPRRTITP